MNATIETPTFSNLARVIGTRESKTIGHNTVARRSFVDGHYVIDVELHGNRIARLDVDRIELSNAGYETQTTRARLDAIAEANGLGLRFGQRKGIQTMNGEPWDGEHVVVLNPDDEWVDAHYAALSTMGNEIVG
jgi:hypothetical protein